MKGKVFSINISEKKGEKKRSISFGILKENFGIVGDAHSGIGKKQISLLPFESFSKIKNLKVEPGIFAENITTKGIDFNKIKVGDLIKIGRDVLLKVEEIGKKCHKPCEIYKKNGICIMPTEGIFASVLKGGKIKKDFSIKIINKEEEF